MTERNGGGKSAGPAPELHAVGAIYEPGALDPTGGAHAHIGGLPRSGKGAALLGDFMAEAGQPYVRVTDLTTVPVGARLRVDNTNHTSSHLTVIGAYGKHGRPASDGLLCHVEAFKGDAWDTVLTPLRAENSAVWLLSTPISDGDPDA